MEDRPSILARIGMVAFLVALSWLALYGFADVCYHVIIWVGGQL